MKKHIVITGAYGLVGSTICKIIENKYPKFKLIKIKCDFDSSKIKSVDYIIHCAGYGQPQMFGKDKVKTLMINTQDTNRLFQLLKPEGKFVFISSSEVYSGAIPPHTEEMIGTTTPQHARACYIEAKRCGEAITGAYREQGYDAKIARLALAYGEGTKKHDTRVLNELIEQALTKGVIKLKDTGSAIRTYCYVEDAADMIVDILMNGTQPVYNVGGISTVSIRDLALMIGKITGVQVILGDTPLEGAPSSVRLNITRTLWEFPRTFVTLEEGLIRTIEYQKQLYGN